MTLLPMLRFPGMARNERARQVAVSIMILGGIAGIFVLVVLGRHLPGLPGEFFARVAGVITTPFLMEASVCFLGLIIVMLLNHWRRVRDGDELVYLDEIEDAPDDLPPSAKWAVYREQPLAPENPTAADLLEGALAIGDHESAIEALASMDDTERHQPEIMKLRIALAKATGKEELARRLESELAG
ncbi:hypothetical protein [Luteolibacter marinus]|uniref:hypothetical protein n=1 Tax=Luteolibacter marinus TaxID=2776705 RepID=UPI001868916D|nr:hypothetical protein [Luteolibacter marinus]